MTAMDRKQLLERLSAECNYSLDEKIMNEFLDSMEERRLHRKEPLIESGKRNSDVYILTDGITRMAYSDGEKIRTFAFGLPGTMSVSFHSYYMGLPAVIQIEACCESTVLRSSKSNFDHFIATYPEFALWVLNMAHCQLYYYEMKVKVINGNAKERLLSLYRNRPEIIRSVSWEMIASYLDITQAYLCRLKKRLIESGEI